MESLSTERARRSLTLVYDPEALVVHRVTPDRVRWSYFRRRCFAEGISKAVVAGLTGADAALATERAYVSRVLPAGIARGLGLTARGRVVGLGQSLAIVVGTLFTTLGYLRGRLSR